jgi:predicted DCC family thiol-disulfide oxidoreductase YuxK
MAEQNTKEDIILFDGECMMCSAIVRFVIARDPAGRFRFASLGSDTGAAIRNRFLRGLGMRSAARSGQREEDNVREVAAGGMDNIDLPAPDTFMLVRGDRIYMKSRAGLEVVKRLRGAWPLLYAFIVVPSPIRDKVYDYIARNRYRWFGRSDHCMLPSPENKDRFLE